VAEATTAAELATVAQPDGASTAERAARDGSGLPASQAVRPLRVAVVGMSVSRTCGVRAHAELLAGALGRERVACAQHWLSREQGSLRAGRAEVRAWTRALAAELQESRPDAVLWHYSIFAHSYRGLPVFVGPTLSALRGAGVPVVALMHELAYPWRLGGWRGDVWALAQRARLIDVVRACAAVVVTTDFRAEWLASRRWLARRPLGVAPVFSNLPPPTPRTRPDRDSPILGLFGYSYDERSIALVLDAARLLQDRGVHFELALLGAPGRASPLAETWLRLAGARGLTGALSFAGPLLAQDLSDELAACKVLLFADTAGPSSRKGTLAGSLASGRPLVATDGPRRWSALVQAEAARVVEPSAPALADAVAALLADEGAREALGARGRVFAEQDMGVARSAEVVRELLGEVLAAGGPPRG
jgi:glycosyltransferase involved in cell wall biosynthesis